VCHGESGGPGTAFCSRSERRAIAAITARSPEGSSERPPGGFAASEPGRRPGQAWRAGGTRLERWAGTARRGQREDPDPQPPSPRSARPASAPFDEEGHYGKEQEARVQGIARARPRDSKSPQEPRQIAPAGRTSPGSPPSRTPSTRLRDRGARRTRAEQRQETDRGDQHLPGSRTRKVASRPSRECGTTRRGQARRDDEGEGLVEQRGRSLIPARTGKANSEAAAAFRPVEESEDGQGKPEHCRRIGQGGRP